MNHFRYRPSGVTGWLAAAAERQLLVIHPSAAETGISAYGASLGLGFQATLDELTRGGLSATPPFALLEWSGEAAQPVVRVIVRGDVRVLVTASGSEHALDGAGVSTWTEQSFVGVTGVDVTVEASAAGSESSEAWLPLQRGTALVTRITSVAATEPVGESVVAKAAGKVAQKAPIEAKPAEPAVAEVSVATMAERPAAVADPVENGQAKNTQATTELDPDVRPGDAGYDYLFGETMYRSVSEAAVREPDSEAESPVAETPAAEVAAGDHDGMTIMTGQLKKLRGNRKAAASPAAPAEVAQSLYLELSTGSRELLTQPVLVGRSPTASKVSGGALPRLVAIPGDKDISRNHAQFAVEGGTVVVTDLHSRNGTQVIMPGRSPQQLRQGEPTAVIVGTIVDLGGGVTLTVRENE